MLLGAHLAGTALASVGMGLHHGLCHALGGGAGVPHGVANSIVLPHALRYNADMTAPELALVAEAMGVAGAPAAAAEAAIERIELLIGQLNLPQCLRETRVTRADFPRLAGLALQTSAVRNNPKPIVNPDQVLEVLEAAW
jgi:alcohol dehydrogenase class IV